MSRLRFLVLLLLVFYLGAARESRAQAPGYTVAFSATQYSIPETQYYKDAATLVRTEVLPDDVYINIQITEYPGAKTTYFGYRGVGNPATLGIRIYSFGDDDLYN